jgi:hypothetical protein
MLSCEAHENARAKLALADGKCQYSRERLPLSERLDDSTTYQLIATVKYC